MNFLESTKLRGRSTRRSRCRRLPINDIGSTNAGFLSSVSQVTQTRKPTNRGATVTFTRIQIRHHTSHPPTAQGGLISLRRLWNRHLYSAHRVRVPGCGQAIAGRKHQERENPTAYFAQTFRIQSVIRFRTSGAMVSSIEAYSLTAPRWQV